MYHTSVPTPVAPGIEALRLPLPFALDHVNLWLLADGDGWVLVDSGFGDEDGCARWEDLLAGPLAGRRFTRLICTHSHPDHMGLAGWLAGRLGVTLLTSRGEWEEGRQSWFADPADLLTRKLAHYHRLGYPPERLEAMRQGGDIYRSRISPPPDRFEPLAEGDEVRIGDGVWRVLTFGGHSPEHVCLWNPEADILIAGDQILPTISPVVACWPDAPESDPLHQFLDGLAALRRLPAETLVLPAHGMPFRRLRERCDDLAEHHRRRLAAIAAACTTPATGFEIVTALFTRPLDIHQQGFAGGEILAHLNRLEADGQIHRTDSPAGVWRFHCPPPVS